MNVLPAKKSTCWIPPPESLAFAFSWMDAGAVYCASGAGAVSAAVGGTFTGGGSTSAGGAIRMSNGVVVHAVEDLQLARAQDRASASCDSARTVPAAGAGRSSSKFHAVAFSSSCSMWLIGMSFFHSDVCSSPWLAKFDAVERCQHFDAILSTSPFERVPARIAEQMRAEGTDRSVTARGRPGDRRACPPLQHWPHQYEKSARGRARRPPRR